MCFNIIHTRGNEKGCTFHLKQTKKICSQPTKQAQWEKSEKQLQWHHKQNNWTLALIHNATFDDNLPYRLKNTSYLDSVIRRPGENGKRGCRSYGIQLIITSARSTGSKKGQPSSWIMMWSKSFWHKANLAFSFGSLLPEVLLLWLRCTGDDEREESIERRPRPRAAIFILPLRVDLFSGEGERDENDRDDEDNRRRFVGFLSALALAFRERGGGDGDEDTSRFLDRLVFFFVCLLLGREVLRDCFFLTTLILRWSLFWAAGKRKKTHPWYLDLLLVFYFIWTLNTRLY